MKKSFMTRVLASGLSLAMAFSMAAATNVTTASAASKPKMIQYDGSSAKNLSVKLGESVKIKVNAATQAKYKVSAVKVSSSKLKATKNKAGTVVKITGAKATEEGKPASVKVSFQVKTTKKASKYAYVSKVSVIDDKLTMAAEATGVKTITVTFNKPISDASKVKATVKKETADRSCTATVEGSKITLAMDAKLTKGSYTVTVEGVDEAPMTANLEVAKDETLTSYEISDYLVAASVTNITAGSIKYAALNQYGEKMAADTPTVSCSFGTVGTVTAASATNEGTIEIPKIEAVLAIVGNKGTVVLVDKTTGVTATKEITYNVAATATTLDVVGTYDTNSAKLKTITEGDKIENYELLVSAKDQYGYSLKAKDFKGVTATIAGALTKIEKASDTWSDRTVDGVDYIALKLKGADNSKAVAGDATLTIVNQYKGLLTTSTITVAKNTVIKSISITADNGVYAGQANELSYEIVDAEGKSVTDYATLNDKLDLTQTKGNMRLEKNKDGSAKLLYEPDSKPVDSTDARTGKASTIEAETIYANNQTSGDYIVKPVTFTVYQARHIKTITGIADGNKSVSMTGGKFDIKAEDLIFADQYSNKVTKDDSTIGDSDVKAAEFVTGSGVAKANATTGVAIAIVTNNAIDVDIQASKITVTPKKVGTATVYLSYKPTTDKDVTASDSSYDAKFTISVFDTEDADASALEIKSVNDGFKVTTKQAIDKDTMAGLVKVVSKIGGSEVTIPGSQYKVIKLENNEFNAETEKSLTNKTAKVTVQVTTYQNGTNVETVLTKEFTVSRDARKLFKVTGGYSDATKASSGAISASGAKAVFDQKDFLGLFDYKDQYGSEVSGGAITNGTAKVTSLGAVKFDIELVSKPTDATFKISTDETSDATVTLADLGEGQKIVFKVYAISEDGSKKDVTFTYTGK